MLSLATFIGSGSAKALAEGQLGVPVVKAQVMDDGTVNINPIHLKNSHDTQIKVQSSRFETEAEAYFDEEMRAATCGIEGLGGTVYAGPAEGEYYYGNAYDRVAPGEVGDFNISITGLSAEKANSYLDQVVYVAEITFEDAVVPIPEATDFEYDGHFHNGVPIDMDHYLLLPGESHVEGIDENSKIFARDVKRESQEEVPEAYITSAKLLPGFIWEDETDEVKNFEWTINPAPLYIYTEDGQWDYDMTEHTAPGHVEGLHERACVTGFVPPESEIPPVEFKQEVVGLSTTSITHHYESAEAGESGLRNVGTVDYTTPPRDPDTTLALAINYYEVHDNEGYLNINQIEFIHQETRAGQTDWYPGVVAPEQTSFPYNTRAHGEDPDYHTLEYAYPGPSIDWAADPVQKYYDGADMVEGTKQIINVSDSGYAEYVITSTVTDSLGFHPEGDYKETYFKYYLEITPRDLSDPDLQLNLINLDGQENVEELPYQYNRYEYTGSEIKPKFEPTSALLMYVRIKIDDTYGYICSIGSEWLTAFEFNGGAIEPGDHETTLIAKEKRTTDNVANNFTGSLQIPFHIYAMTTVQFDATEIPGWTISAVSKETGAKTQINPDETIYAEANDIKIDLTNTSVAPSDDNPLQILLSAKFLHSTPATNNFNYQMTDGEFSFEVPQNEGSTDYASAIEITTKESPSLKFTDETGLSIGDRPEEAGMENYYSTIQYQVGSTSGEWLPYTTVKHYPLGTKLFRHEDCLVTSDKAYGDSDVTYFRVDLGAQVNPALSTKDHVTKHYKMDYRTISDTTILDGETNITYSLTANPRYQIKYKEENPTYKAHIIGQSVIPGEFGSDVWFSPGQTVFDDFELLIREDGDSPWHAQYGWDLNYNGNTIFPTNDEPRITITTAAAETGVNEFDVEPFALINLVDSSGADPATTTFSYQIGAVGYVPYAASANLGIYVPKGTAMTSPEEGSRFLTCGKVPYVMNNGGTIQPHYDNVDDRSVNFRANPAEHYIFSGWDASYTVGYDATALLEYNNPSYTITVSSEEDTKYQLTWPKETPGVKLFVGVGTESRPITESPAFIYEGENLDLLFDPPYTTKFTADFNGENPVNFNFSAGGSYHYAAGQMPAKASTITLTNYKEIEFDEKIITTLGDIRFNTPDILISKGDEDHWISIDTSTDLIPFTNFTSTETTSGNLFIYFNETTAGSPNDNKWYFKTKNNDAAFEPSGWEPAENTNSVEFNEGKIPGTYVFTQLLEGQLAQISTNWYQSAEEWYNKLEVSSTNGSDKYIYHTDHAGGKWNYAQKNTELKVTAADAVDVAGYLLHIEHLGTGAAAQDIPFVAGTGDEAVATIDADSVDGDILLSMKQKPSHTLTWEGDHIVSVTAGGAPITTGAPVDAGDEVVVNLSLAGDADACTISATNSASEEYNYTGSLSGNNPTYKFTMPDNSSEILDIDFAELNFGQDVVKDPLLGIRFNPATVQIWRWTDIETGTWNNYEPDNKILMPALNTNFAILDEFQGKNKVLQEQTKNIVFADGSIVTIVNHFSILNNDAAFDFTDWEYPSSADQAFDNEDPQVKCKFNQRTDVNLYKVECDSTTFEGLTDVTITDENGYGYTSKNDPANPGWNYAPISTGIIVSGDANELLNCKLKVEYADTSSEEINFAEGIATIPAAKITQNIKLTIEKPTPAGRTISLGSSFKQLYEEVAKEGCTVDCFINGEKFNNVDDTIIINEDAISLKLGISFASSSTPNEGYESQFVFNNCDSSNKVTSKFYETHFIDAVSEEPYTLVWNVSVDDISQASDYIEIQIAKHWMTYEEYPATFNFKWDSDPSSDIKLYQIYDVEGTWVPDKERPCSEVGIDIPLHGKAYIDQIVIDDVSVDAIIVLSGDGSNDNFGFYSLWDNSDQPVVWDQYTMSISLNESKYAQSIGTEDVIGSDQYVFAVTPATANNNDSNGGGSYEPPAFYDDGQDNGGDFEYLGDDTWAIQILRKFDLFHLFF